MTLKNLILHNDDDLNQIDSNSICTIINNSKIRSPRYPTPLFKAMTIDQPDEQYVVYGDLVRCNDKYYIHPIGNSFKVEHGLSQNPIILHEVNPETIELIKEDNNE